MKRMLLALVALGLVLGACGDKAGEKEENEEALPACSSTPAPPTQGTVSLPSTFPTPSGVTYLATAQTGPSTITVGVAAEGLEELYESYAEALDDRDGYAVDKKEREERDAEVFFASGDSTGQVKLEAACDGYTEIKITVRPK